MMIQIKITYNGNLYKFKNPLRIEFLSFIFINFEIAAFPLYIYYHYD